MTVIVMRVEDLEVPYVPSTVLVCDRCGTPVWLDVKNVPVVRREAAKVVCQRCALPELLVCGMDGAMVGGDRVDLPDDMAGEIMANMVEDELGRS
jgi:hypothetical protein